ncbi:MAG TPA: hypothetical protein VF950_19010 [Planctomycetota bacterium]
MRLRGTLIAASAAVLLVALFAYRARSRSDFPTPPPKAEPAPNTGSPPAPPAPSKVEGVKPVQPPPPGAGDIEARVGRLEIDLLALLSRLGPEAGLAHLDRLLARPPLPPGDRLTDERVERILAAACLAWCAAKQPSLVSAARTVARSRGAVEGDPLVRRQLVWILAGVKMTPVAVELADEEGRERTVEAFAVQPREAPAWAGALGAPDPPFDNLLLGWLLERAADRKEKAREAALRALLVSALPEARQAALDLYLRDPAVRAYLTESLAKNPENDALAAFTSVLATIRDTSSIQTIARALTDAASLPKNSGTSILQAYEGLRADSTSPDKARARSALARAAVRSQSLDGDPSALACVNQALSDPVSEVALSAVEAAIDQKAVGLTSTIRTAWQAAPDPYRKAALAYGLRGLDPAFQEPNPFWDLRLLKAALTAATSVAERERVLERIRAVDETLKALKKP